MFIHKGDAETEPYQQKKMYSGVAIGGRQMGACTLRRRLWGTSAHFLQSLKNAF